MGVADLDPLVGFPVAHVEGVGDDAGAGSQLAEQAGAQLFVDRLQQIQAHHGGRADIDAEQVLLDEVDEAFDPGPTGLLHGVGDPHRVDVHPDAACVAVPGGGDHDPSVARPEVVEQVPGADAG
ncbi:hypothetical protein FQZ97_942100 [compost metagenome]